jgi:hypothetical protein
LYRARPQAANRKGAAKRVSVPLLRNSRIRAAGLGAKGKRSSTNPAAGNIALSPRGPSG